MSVADPWETAAFYKDSLGLDEVAELDGPLAEGVFLTDGVVNLALLHFKSDEAAQGTGNDFVGLHVFFHKDGRQRRRGQRQHRHAQQHHQHAKAA